MRSNRLLAAKALPFVTLCRMVLHSVLAESFARSARSADYCRRGARRRSFPAFNTQPIEDHSSQLRDVKWPRFGSML